MALFVLFVARMEIVQDVVMKGVKIKAGAKTFNAVKTKRLMVVGNAVNSPVAGLCWITSV